MRDPAFAWISYNGEFYRAGSALLTGSNRGLRYGDGLFETILVQDGRIRLEDYHFDRLLTGMRFLQFVLPAHFSQEFLVQQILDLCKKNGHQSLSRVRLTVFRGEGHLFEAVDDYPLYFIESSSLSGDQLNLNKDGLRVDIYPGGRKACDPLANMKSNNFLLYSQAARYARDRQLDDCLVLNSRGGIADSCIANLFYVRREMIATPPLSEGCVAGVMRRFLLRRMDGWGFPVQELALTPEDCSSADEIFLTNALKGIRWVGGVGGKALQPGIARELHERIIKEA